MAFLVAPIRTENRNSDPVKSARAKAKVEEKLQVQQQATQPAASSVSPTAQQAPKGLASGMLFRDQLTKNRANDSMVEVRKSASQKLKEARTLYDTYIQSDEYRQNLAAADQKARMDRWMTATITGSSDTIMQPIKDQKEQELKALVDHYTAQVQQEEIRKTTEASLHELETWEEEDRAALQTYIINRNMDDTNRMNPMTGPGGTDTATAGASALIAKYGLEKVNQLAESLEWHQSEEMAEMVDQAGREGVNNGAMAAVGHNAASIPAQVIGGLTGLFGRLQELGHRTGQYPTMNPNSIGNLPSVYSGAVRGETAGNIEENIGGTAGKLASLGYQGLMSTADSYARMLMGGGSFGGAALAATNTFSQTMSEASAQGATPGQAALLATTKAGVEALSEKIPLDNLLDTAKSGGKGLTDAVIDAFAQAGVEIITEEISLFSSVLADAAIMREKSSYRDMSVQDLLMEAAETAVISGISGGASSVGASAVGNVMAPTANLQQNPQIAAENAAPVKGEPEAAVTPEEAAEQLGRESPKAEPVQKSEQELTLERAMDETFGREGNEAGSAAGELERLQAQEESAEESTVGGEYEFSNIARANYAINELRESDDWNSMTQAQRVKAINEIMDYYTKVVDETAPGIAPEYIKQTQKNAASEETTVTVNSAETNAISNPLDSYPTEKQNSIRSYIKSVDESIKGFVQRVKNGDTTFRRQKISDVNDRTAKDVGDILGIDAGGYTHNINTNGVQHIINRHGENGEQDHSMALDDDIARVGWVLDNYDSVELLTENGEQVYSSEFRDSNDRPAPQIRFVKKIDGNYYVVEAACENKYRKLWVQSAYLQKNNGDVTQAPAEGPSANHETNARSALASPSPDISLPQSGQEVNGNIDERRAQVVDGQEKSMEGGQPGIKGTGAAEANFSGKAAYQDLLTEDNVQPDRPGDVRPMEVPEEDSYGRNVSEFAANAYGAAVTPNRMANEIEQLIQDGALGFDRVSNEEALNNARDAIYGKEGQKGRGESRTMTDIRKNIYNGKIQDGDIEKALLLYAKYANRKSESSLDNAAELMVDLTSMAHMTGRNLQLFKLLRRMTPEGQLLAVQRSVERYTEDMVAKGKVKKGYDPSIDQELMDDYLEAAKELKEADTPGKQKDAEQKVKEAEEAIYAAEAAKLPATFKAKWDAWRYMCMLGNVKTQVRNIAGNAAFRPYKDVKDAIGAGLERLAGLDKSQRTKAVLNIANEGDLQLLSWAKADAKSDTVRNALKYSAKLGDDVTGSKMEEKVQVFDTKALEAVRKFVEKVPAEADLLFKNGHYERSLAGFLKARGYSAADLQAGRVQDAVLNEARSYAVDEAMKATFNDCNACSDFFASIGKNPAKKDNLFTKVFNVAAEAVLPFRRTPANIVVRFTEYSPVGLTKGVWDAATKIRNGEISAAAAIDQMAAGVTGTAAMTLGFFLAKGIGGFKLKGSGVDEDEERQGHQAYSVEFSIDGREYSYRIDWAAPANLPLFVGANLYELMSGGGEDDVEVSKLTSFLYSLGTMFEPMLSLSCLSSLNDLFEAGKYSDGKALYSVAAQMATSYITQGVPALARQAVQAASKNQQTTFANDEDPLVRDLQRMGARTGVMPWLKTDKVNAWGETEGQENGLLRTFNAFINPGTLKEIDNGQLEQEITRLNESQPDSVSPPDTPKTISYTDANGERISGHRLTEEEYSTLATVQGQTTKGILDEVLESDTYAAMTDQQKVSVFEYVYDYAREKGRSEALAGYEGLDGWMEGIEGNEADAILNKAVKNAFTDAFEQLVTDPEGAAAALDQAYGLLDQHGITEWAKNAGGRTKYFVEARRRGVDAVTFAGLYQQFRDIDQNPDYNTGDKAAEWSYQLEKAQEAGTITKQQKDALKDSMVYYQMFPAETAKFDQMTENGISADKAMDIGQLLDGIKPQEGYTNVRDVQKAGAIANSTSLSRSDKTAAMKIYLSDAQDENLDLMLGLGYGPEDYAAVYEIYSGERGKGKKARTISKIQHELGVDYGTAREIYEIYG